MSAHCHHDGDVCPDCGGALLTAVSFADAVMGVLSESPERLLGAMAILLTQTAVLAATAPHGVVPGVTDVPLEAIFDMNAAMAQVSEVIHQRLIEIVPEPKEREIRARLAAALGYEG